MKVVLDANVIVSALLSTQGAPRQILNLWQAEELELLTSSAILDEIGRVLRYPKIAALHRLSEVELETFLALLSEESQVIVPTDLVDLSPDEPDNRYLECALAGDAEFVVTGDKRHLLPIGSFQGIQIVSPASFIAIWQLGA